MDYSKYTEHIDAIVNLVWTLHTPYYNKAALQYLNCEAILENNHNTCNLMILRKAENAWIYNTESKELIEKINQDASIMETYEGELDRYKDKLIQTCMNVVRDKLIDLYNRGVA